MFFHSHILYSLQTLSQLNLGYNNIRDEGVQYLSEALKQNRVSSNQRCFHVFPYSYSLFVSDTFTTRYRKQSN